MESCGISSTLFFDDSELRDRAQMERLLERKSPKIVDTFSEQCEELSEVRGNRREIGSGQWVYYPWQNAMVHLLSREDFIELRTSRNQHKITRAEQEALARKRIGIVGLSVGHSVAMTLALERIGGELRIADFDRLSLSNLNRIRSSVFHLGISKTELTRREIAELDPYLAVRAFPDGLGEENLEEFFLAGGRLDLIIDECDDLALKVRIRQFARSHRIPVLMETSDRGLLDIERFDLEPGRPIFHGLIEESKLDPRKLRACSAREKVPFVLEILGGARQLSPRAAASLMEIGSTIQTWPQLGSAVTWGGGVVADTARRLLLGEPVASGRFRLDLDRWFGTEARSSAPESGSLEENREALLPAPAPCQELELDPLVRSVAKSAVRAPSGGNAQPWKLRYQASESVLELRLDPARARTFLDFEHRASWMAIGAALENAVLAAHSQGTEVAVAEFPSDAEPELAARMRLRVRPAESTESHDWDRLAPMVPVRKTSRHAGDGLPIPAGTLRALVLAAGSVPGARLLLLDSRDEIAELGRILGAADRLRFLNPTLFAELMSEIRWSRESAEATGDGIELDSLGLSEADRAAIELCRSEPAMELLRTIEGSGKGFAKGTQALVSSSPAMGLLTFATEPASPCSSPARTYLRGGRALSRLWLEATAHGLSFQPVSALPYLFSRLLAEGSPGFASAEREELLGLRARYENLFDLRGNPAEILLFRLFTPGPAPCSGQSLRRPLSEALTLGGSP